MSQIRLLVDEDAQHRGLAPALRARGVDVVTAHEAGLTGQDDDLILAHAVNDGRTVYTFNAGDFRACTAGTCGKDRTTRELLLSHVNATPSATNYADCFT